MHHAALLCQLAIWVTGTQAFLPFHPKHAHDVKVAEKRDAVTRDVVGSMPGFVTFKMAKAGSSVRAVPTSTTARTLQLWITS